jgi:anti-sigma factor (TIGR02949 family)
MTCEDFQSLMTAYLDGELPDDDRESFEHHITSCDRCQAEMSTYQNCTRLFQRFSKDEDPPDALRKSVFERCDCENPSACCPPPKKAN